MKRFKIGTLVLATALTALTTLPLAAHETLTKTLISAYKNSQLLEQNRALLRAADENVAQAVASLRPVVNFVATANTSRNRLAGTSNTASIALSAEVLIYDFGATKLGVEVQKETVLATRQALISIEQNVLLNAVSAYMTLLQANETVRLSNGNVRLITQELRAAQDRFEVGEITRTDVSLAQSRLAAARANLAASQGQRAAAREFYKAAVGRAPGTLSQPPKLPKTARNLASARAIAVRTHPAIVQAQHQVKSAELTVAQSEAAMKPRVTLGGNIGHSTSADNNHSITLQGIAPLYQGGAMSSRYRQAFMQAESQRFNLQQNVRIISQNAADAWSNVEVTKAQISAINQQIRASQIAFRGVREEATLGARTTLDVLDAEQELLNARTSLVSAQADLYIATYQLLSAMGLLTVDHLNLGIPTYDPAGYYNAVKDAPRSSRQGEALDRILRKIGNN